MGNCPTDLRNAIRENRPEKVGKILQKAGDKSADVINNDHSPPCIFQSCTTVEGNAFYFAVQRGRMEVLKILIDYGADVHSTGIFEETCLQCAVRNNYLDVVRMLIEAGCDIHATDDRGNLPIHNAGATIFDTSELVKYLLQIGSPADINSKNYNGRTPLHEASSRGNLDVCDTMLKCGADINATTNKGSTPLHLAKNYTIFDFLVSKGANREALDKNGLTALRPK